MITIHRQLKYVLIFALGLFFGSTAFASASYTYERTPNTTTADIYTITLNVVEHAGWRDSFCYYPNTATQWGFRFISGGNVVMSSPLYPIQGGTYSWNVSSVVEQSVGTVVTTCYYSNGDIAVPYDQYVEGFGGDTIFTLNAYTAPILGGAFSFVDFNDVSPSDMVASVREGTVETTGKTLPLLIFLGIPLAFLLLVMVSKLISDTVKPEKKGRGREWTAHGVMEHDLTAFKKKERSRIKRDLPL